MSPTASPSRTITSASEVRTPDPRHIMNPNRCSILDEYPRGVWPALRTYKPMASKRIQLDPQTIEAIARRVVELLEQRGL